MGQTAIQLITVIIIIIVVFPDSRTIIDCEKFLYRRVNFLCDIYIYFIIITIYFIYIRYIFIYIRYIYILLLYIFYFYYEQPVRETPTHSYDFYIAYTLFHLLFNNHRKQSNNLQMVSTVVISPFGFNNLLKEFNNVIKYLKSAFYVQQST